MPIKINEYDSVTILDYKGKYRIEQGREKEGKWYASKVRKYVWDKEKRENVLSDKDGNLSIPLGDADTAKAVLEALLREIAPPF